jgi:hypothetical protein
MAPDTFRRDVVIGGQIFCALAGGDDAKAGRASPVHHFGGQCRLVAIGQRIDHAGLARFLGEQRPRQHVGLDIDHDDVLAGRDRGAGMPDADRGIAGRFHDDIHRAARDGARAVVGEDGGRDPRLVPADRAACLAGTVAVDIDDQRYLQPRRVRYLCQKHRAEFPGADQCHADRFAGSAAGLEQVMQVHGMG